MYFPTLLTPYNLETSPLRQSFQLADLRFERGSALLELMLFRSPRLARAFNDVETAYLRQAYSLAVTALSLTHLISDDMETKLANVVIRVYTADRMCGSGPAVDVEALASKSLDYFLMVAAGGRPPLYNQ